MFNWDYEYTIYIPAGIPNWLIESFQWNMEQHFGGYTRYDADGAYVSNEKKTIKEPVYVYKIVSEDPKDYFFKKISDSLIANGEEAVLWTKAPIEIGKD